MRLNFDLAVHYSSLNRYLDEHPNKVTIASYGIYAGITFANEDTAEWGDKYQLATRSFINRLKSVNNVRILVGISEYRSCKNDNPCLDCEKQYVKSLIRLLNHAEKFDYCEWKMMYDLHLKCCVFENGDNIKGICGGRNLSDSSWNDVSIEMAADECVLVKSLVDRYWANAMVINNTELATVLENQGISELGFNSISD